VLSKYDEAGVGADGDEGDAMRFMKPLGQSGRYGSTRQGRGPQTRGRPESTACAVLQGPASRGLAVRPHRCGEKLLSADAFEQQLCAHFHALREVPQLAASHLIVDGRRSTPADKPHRPKRSSSARTRSRTERNASLGPLQCAVDTPVVP
jgi:hypothetical protein